MPFVRGDLPVHLPADPQERQASSEREADDLEKLRRDRREQNAQHHGRGDAEDHPVADLGATREASGPTTIALSPASTTSIMMILMISSQFVRHHSGEATDRASFSKAVGPCALSPWLRLGGRAERIADARINGAQSARDWQLASQGRHS